jgi:hypothetical protein
MKKCCTLYNVRRPEERRGRRRGHGASCGDGDQECEHEAHGDDSRGLHWSEKGREEEDLLMKD